MAMRRLASADVANGLRQEAGGWAANMKGKGEVNEIKTLVKQSSFVRCGPSWYAWPAWCAWPPCRRPRLEIGDRPTCLTEIVMHVLD